jgi:hypothetical protein
MYGFSPTSSQTFVVGGGFDDSYNLSVVLICLSFMARDSEHFFMCFMAI